MAYAILDNYPEVGCIAWIDCHIVYKGVDYEITNQYTDAFYVWWDFDYPNVFQAGNEFPELDDDDVLVFLNKNGTHLTVPTASVVDGGLIVPESIHTNALAANSITGVKILAGEISAAHLAADSVGAVAIAAGAVTAEKINVETLAAISANLGVVNAGYIQVGEQLRDITDIADWAQIHYGPKQPTVIEHLDYDSDYFLMGGLMGRNEKAAQSFKPIDRVIGAKKIKVTIIGTQKHVLEDGSVEVHIYDDNDGLPGSSISTTGFASILWEDWPDSSAEITCVITLDEELQADSQYWIVLEQKGYGESNYVKFAVTTENLYTDGMYASGGSSWMLQAQTDMAFKVEAPFYDQKIGDILIDYSDNNKQYRWDGTKWVFATDDVRYDGQIQNDDDVTAYFPFDDSLYDSKNLVQCTFNRDSVAYLPNGLQVGTDIARYDTARIVRGVLIEEGTTNLLTENESSVETDLIGLSSEVINGTGTFTRDTTKKKYGNASAKLTCSSINPGEWMDIYVDKSITGGLAYTFSVNFLASVVSGTRSVRVFVDWYNGSTFLSRTDTAGVTVSPSMSDFIRLSVSDVAPANASRGVFVLILVDPQVGDALYWDGAQLEQKPYPTSWTLGGTTRAPETLIIPTAGIFQKGNWTVDVTYIPNNSDKSLYKLIWMIRIDGTNLYQLYIDQDTGLPTGRVQSDSVYYTIQGSKPVIPGNKYVLTFSGDGATLSFYCNGDLVGSIPYTEPVGDLPSEMQIGTASYGASLSANGIIDELRFSKIARTLEEHQSYYNSGKGYTDIEPIIRAGQEYKGFMITQQDGAKAYSSDGGYTTMNSKGVITKGGNFKIYDEKNILVMDGRGVNPLEVSGWGITSGLTFAVQSLTPTSNYIEVQTTSSLPYSQTLPYNLYLNDVSKLGSSGKLISLNNLNDSIALYYNAVDTVNKYVTVYSRDSQVDVNIGYYLVAAEVNGVTQPAPSAIARLLIKAGSAILRNGTYIKFPNDITYDMPVSVSLGDADGWQYRVLFINGNGQITHLATGTAGSLIDKWGIDTYPAHPRYNNIGTGTPDPNCIVLGTILCGGTKNYSFNAHEIMHPDFRDERALKVNNLVYSLPAYYGDVKTIEKSVLTTSAVSIGSWTTNSISLSSGQKYEVAVPIGKGKRMAIVSFCGVAVDLSYQDTSFTGAVLFVGLKNPWKRAWQPCISIGYGDHFIDSYFQDAYGNFVVHENSMGWTYRRITDAYLNIGVDGETYFHFVLYQRTNSENRGLRVNWFAF